ncbi:MAG: lysozyme [Taibaiella sp.]|nr:lysozyme [Taibaiella sp.]
MKRLALLLILSPLFLFGQNRQSAIADSIRKSGNNLQSVADYVSKVPGTNIDRIGVTDSNGYVTLVVRLKVADMQVAPLTFATPVAMKTKAGQLFSPPMTPSFPVYTPLITDVYITPVEFVAPIAIKTTRSQLFSPQEGPSLPAYRPLMEPDTIDALYPASMVSMRNTLPPVTKAAIVTVPVFPFEPEEPEPLPILNNKPFAITAPRKLRARAVQVPFFEEKKMEVSEMHLSDEGYSLLEKLEGFSPELYSLKDGGFTIGFGFFVPYGEANKWKKGITIEEAEVIIREKVPAYEDQVKQYINVPLTQTEFDALTMLAYNLGGFAKATSIVNDINSGGDFGKLQHDWMRFVHSKAPNVMKGLMNRRKDELRVRNEMYYQPDRKLLIYNNR